MAQGRCRWRRLNWLRLLLCRSLLSLLLSLDLLKLLHSLGPLDAGLGNRGHRSGRRHARELIKEVVAYARWSLRAPQARAIFSEGDLVDADQAILSGSNRQACGQIVAVRVRRSPEFLVKAVHVGAHLQKEGMVRVAWVIKRGSGAHRQIICDRVLGSLTNDAVGGQAMPLLERLHRCMGTGPKMAVDAQGAAASSRVSQLCQLGLQVGNRFAPRSSAKCVRRCVLGLLVYMGPRMKPGIDRKAVVMLLPGGYEAFEGWHIRDDMLPRQR